MKILIVVDSINIEDSSGSKANVALIQNLSEAGFEVLVYHYTLKNIQLSGVNCFAIPELKYNLMYFLSRLQRVLNRNCKINVAPFLERKFGFSFTFFNDTTSIVKALKKCDFNPDLVLTLSKGTSFRPHYSLLKLPEWHHKWMAYVHDPYPFHYYPRPYAWVETSYKFKDDFFIKVSQKARFSAFPSLLLIDWMGSYFSNFIKTGIVIPHQNTNYTIQNTNLPDYFDPTKFNLLHAGNLLLQRSPMGLLEGFELFLKNNSGARDDSKLFLLGPATSHLDTLQKYKNSTNIHINMDYSAFDVVYHLQTRVCVNIILEAKSEISPFLPGKFPHCIEANKKILSLAPFFSETRRLLGHDYEFWSEVDDVKKIACLIEKLYQLWKKNPDNMLLNRKDLEEYISVSYLRKVINKLDLEIRK
jgi:hypothetical protein